MEKQLSWYDTFRIKPSYELFENIHRRGIHQRDFVLQLHDRLRTHVHNQRRDQRQVVGVGGCAGWTYR